LLDVALSPCRLIFPRDVAAERDLCIRNLILSKCCGDLSTAVEDNPRGAPEDFLVDSAPGSKPEMGTFASTRHRSRSLSISAKVTNSLPAIFSTVSRPRRASRRKLLSDMLPSGNTSAAATDSRKGVFGPTFSKDFNAGLRTSHLTIDSTTPFPLTFRTPNLSALKSDAE
jgi:hypothetical protein